MRKMVSVIVPTYRDWERLRLCIAALTRQSYQTEFLEIIVVNNDPANRTPDMDFPETFQMITEAKPGSYASRNAGLAIAKGEIIAFTDSDCIPDDDWIKKGVERLELGANRVAGRIELFFKSPKLTIAEVYEKAYAFEQESTSKKGGCMTANMFTWRRHFDLVGLFDESLLSGGDNQWGWRARELGISIDYAPDVIVRHPARSSLGEILKRRQRILGGKFYAKKRQSLLKLVLLGFIPPVRELLKPWRKPEMMLKEKFVASSLAYYIRVYSTIYTIGLTLGINHPQRE